METQIPNLNVQTFTNVEALTDYLQPLAKCRFITQNDVDYYVAQKKEQMVLDKHTYMISQGKGKDKRWFTYVSTQDGGPRTKKRANSREDLIRKLYDIYFGAAESRKNLRLPDVYPEWRAYRIKIVNRTTTVHRNHSDYTKYYVNEPLSEKIMTTPLARLTKVDLEEWAYALIKKHEMTQKAYQNMSLIIRQIYQYLVDKEILQQNTFKTVRIRSTAFKREEKKPAETQVFQKEERDVLFDAAEKKANASLDETFLAIPLMYYTGVRIGECLGLQFSDFNRNTGTVSISRSLARNEELNKNEEWEPSWYEIEDYLKQNSAPREILVPEEAFEIVRKIQAIKMKKGSVGPLLFNVNTPGNVYKKLIRLCLELNIRPRSPHKLRKSNISELINHNLDFDLVMRQAGHIDPNTTRKYYLYSTTKKEDIIPAMEEALN